MRMYIYGYINHIDQLQQEIIVPAEAVGSRQRCKQVSYLWFSVQHELVCQLFDQSLSEAHCYPDYYGFGLVY